MDESVEFGVELVDLGVEFQPAAGELSDRSAGRGVGIDAGAGPPAGGPLDTLFSG